MSPQTNNPEHVPRVPSWTTHAVGRSDQGMSCSTPLIDRLHDTLVAAFEDDPLYRWLFPDPDQRPLAMRDVFALTLESAAARGTIDIAAEGGAVAVWTEPGVDLLDDPEPFVQVLRRWAPRRIGPALRGMAACAVHAPKESRTLHLIGVRPDLRGTGIGSVLVGPVLQRADREGTVTSLDSSNPRNLSFYRRHGFEVVAEVLVADGGPVMRPMHRQPKGGGQGQPWGDDEQTHVR